jgi:TP901 family phage tail tape measure protein
LAGEFENRADTASLRELRASLEALRSELGPQLANLRAQVTRLEQEVSRGGAGARPLRAGETRPLADEEVAPRGAARNIEDRTTRIDRLNNAEQRLVQTRERMRTTPGGVVLPGGARGTATVAEQELAARQAGGAPTILGPGTRGGAAVAREAEARAAAGQAGAVRNVESAMLAETQTRGLAIQQLQRHGALTSEFFSGLARGEVTLREVGSQMAITTAKFGGWLLAGAAVFFVVDAFRQLARGAIDANGAVNKLQQVLPNIDVGKAHEQVRGLATRYNVEFSQVGDALQEAAKHVRDQAGAFQLAGTALEAEKIFPDLKPDTTIKGLTAITRGFKLPLDQSKQVLDELTVLSSHFGVSAADSLTGAAKAAATFANAGGGSTKELLAMVGAMNRLGYSSNEAGTAIRRSAEIIQRPGTKNRGLLEAFGIDIRQPYSQIIRQAVELVSSGQVKGREVNRLATALSTPQLSSRFAAILNRPDIYNRMLRELGAPTVKGAADKRLDTALQSAQQQVKRIGVDLQKLGDELAQGGLFNVLHQLLSTLHGILTVAGGITSAFADLPKGIQQGVVYAGELYVLMRLLRRFGVADRLSNFGGGIAGAASGTSQARSLAQDRQVAARGALDAATARVTTTENEMALASQAYTTAVEQGTASKETIKALETASEQAEREYNVATYRLAAARAALAAREEEAIAIRTGGAVPGGPVTGPARGPTTFIAGAATAEGAQAAQAERVVAEETAMTARLRATSANLPTGVAGRALDTAMWGTYRGQGRPEEGNGLPRASGSIASDADGARTPDHGGAPGRGRDRTRRRGNVQGALLRQAQPVRHGRAARLRR